MNILIYTEDFEPITAIDLPLDILDSAEKNGGIMLALRKNERESVLVQIDCHKLQWIDGSTRPVFVTKDEELALVLKPAWLVGQKAVVMAYERTVEILTQKLKKLRSDD